MSGNYGQVDFLGAAFDGSSVASMVQAAVASGLVNNILCKPALGPGTYISKAQLLAGYQSCNSNRFLELGIPYMPASLFVGGTIPGYALAAGYAGKKAMGAPQDTMYGQSLTGISSQPPRSCYWICIYQN